MKITVNLRVKFKFLKKLKSFPGELERVYVQNILGF